jgi:histidine triad (HIT) family protein
MNTEPTVFSRIIARELPADIVFENENIIVIKNIRPMAPIHLLAITKKPFSSMDELAQSKEPEDKLLLWELHNVLSAIAHEQGLDKSGYRLSTNIGVGGGQSVPHLHVHLLAGMNLTEKTLAE